MVGKDAHQNGIEITTCNTQPGTNGNNRWLHWILIAIGDPQDSRRSGSSRLAASKDESQVITCDSHIISYMQISCRQKMEQNPPATPMPKDQNPLQVPDQPFAFFNNTGLSQTVPCLPPIILCPECNFCLYTDGLLGQHLSIAHRDMYQKAYQCKRCNKILSNSHKARRHMAHHPRCGLRGCKKVRVRINTQSQTRPTPSTTGPMLPTE